MTSVHESIVDAYDGTLMADLNGLQDQINAKLDMASGLVQGANSLQGSVSGALSSTRNSISSANDTLAKSRDLLVKAGKNWMDTSKRSSRFPEMSVWRNCLSCWPEIRH